MMMRLICCAVVLAGLLVPGASQGVDFIAMQSSPEPAKEKLNTESNYPLTEGFRSIKWGTSLDDAKKVYPDLLFVEQIPRADPKFLYYRRKLEIKTFSGVNWDMIRYVFTNDKKFVAANVEMRLELEDKDKAVTLYDALYQGIFGKYGKPFHTEKTDRERYPFVYASIWNMGSESVTLQLKALRDHLVYRNSGIINNISMLEFTLHFYSKRGEGKKIDF